MTLVPCLCAAKNVEETIAEELIKLYHPIDRMEESISKQWCIDNMRINWNFVILSVCKVSNKYSNFGSNSFICSQISNSLWKMMMSFPKLFNACKHCKKIQQILVSQTKMLNFNFQPFFTQSY